jgi:CHAT domain-containing protein
MRAIPTVLGAALLALLGLAAAAPAGAADLAAVGDEIAVGPNAVGEPCRLRLTHVYRERLVVHRYGLFCEGWTVQSGEMRRFRLGAEWTPERLVTDSHWFRSLSARVADCRPVEAAALAGGEPAALRRCAREGVGWPVILGAARINRTLHTFEALPANFRVLERAAEILEGRRAPADTGLKEGGLSVAIRRAEATVGASGKLFAVQDVGAVETLWRLGLRYQRSFEHVAAEQVYRRLLEALERLLGPDDPALAGTLLELGSMLSLLRRFEEADAVYARVEALLPRTLAADVGPRLVAYRSFTARHRGRHAEAVRLAEESLTLRRQHFPPESYEIGHSLGALALALHGAGRFADALSAADRALRVFEVPRGEWERALYWSSQMRQVRAQMLSREGRHAEARVELEQAIAREEQVWGEAPVVAERLVLLGEISRAGGDLDRALDAYRRAAHIWTRSRSARERARPELLAPYLETLLLAAARRPADRPGLLDEAMTAAQLPTGSETARALRQMAARVAAGDPALAAAARQLQDATRRRDRLRVLLSEETARPAAERSAAREEGLRRELGGAEAEMERQEERLQAQFPRYAQLVTAPLLRAADLAALLGPDEALVSFVVGPSSTVVLAARAGGLEAHRAGLGRPALDGLVRRLRRAMEPGPAGLPAFDVAAARDLYQALLAPLAGQLAGARHLVVVPSGPLLSLPFALLVTGNGAPAAAGDYRGLPWLGRDRALSVLPSVSALRDLRAAGRSPAPRPFIGFGDPAFAGAEGDRRGLGPLAAACRQGAGDSALLRALPRLPDTARELRQLAQILGADPTSVITGAEATEGRVRASDLARHRVVAFATHGILPAELRCQAEPGLALTPGDGPGEDGYLDASEVAQLRLDADWVLLSACNTAGPDGRLGGESLSGLARAFLYAGARALLVTHWAVASRAAVALTTGTLQTWSREPGLGRAEALRRTQMAMAGEAATSHPFFWAPFVLVGDGGARP